MMVTYPTEVVLLQVRGWEEVVGAEKMLCQPMNTLTTTILWVLVTTRVATTTKITIPRCSPQCTKYQEEAREETLCSKAEVTKEAATSIPIMDSRECMLTLILLEASSMTPQVTTLGTTRWSSSTTISITIKIQTLDMKTPNTTEAISQPEVVQGSKAHKGKQKIAETLQEEATYKETTTASQLHPTKEALIKSPEIKTALPI